MAGNPDPTSLSPSSVDALVRQNAVLTTTVLEMLSSPSDDHEAYDPFDDVSECHTSEVELSSDEEGVLSAIQYTRSRPPVVRPPVIPSISLIKGGGVSKRILGSNGVMVSERTLVSNRESFCTVLKTGNMTQRMMNRDPALQERINEADAAVTKHLKRPVAQKDTQDHVRHAETDPSVPVPVLQPRKSILPATIPNPFSAAFSSLLEGSGGGGGGGGNTTARGHTADGERRRKGRRTRKGSAIPGSRKEAGHVGRPGDSAPRVSGAGEWAVVPSLQKMHLRIMINDGISRRDIRKNRGYDHRVSKASQRLDPRIPAFLAKNTARERVHTADGTRLRAEKANSLSRDRDKEAGHARFEQRLSGMLKASSATPREGRGRQSISGWRDRSRAMTRQGADPSLTSIPDGIHNSRPDLFQSSEGHTARAGSRSVSQSRQREGEGGMHERHTPRSSRLVPQDMSLRDTDGRASVTPAPNAGGGHTHTSQSQKRERAQSKGGPRASATAYRHSIASRLGDEHDAVIAAAEERNKASANVWSPALRASLPQPKDLGRLSALGSREGNDWLFEVQSKLKHLTPTMPAGHTSDTAGGESQGLGLRVAMPHIGTPNSQIWNRQREREKDHLRDLEELGAESSTFMTSTLALALDTPLDSMRSGHYGEVTRPGPSDYTDVASVVGPHSRAKSSLDIHTPSLASLPGLRPKQILRAQARGRKSALAIVQRVSASPLAVPRVLPTLYSPEPSRPSTHLSEKGAMLRDARRTRRLVEDTMHELDAVRPRGGLDKEDPYADIAKRVLD
ncbi:hypothetical protein KIPB_002586 [Kipferlia bialata]|uniref:Uncharacterized protein n=1 Tax=Kipferlia bialata TaxID=797122 RepID=A0A9K3CRP5_9EUKA|nr:hypothetical protein KIPB_002586 [Kipferlia bialata]|eukprot:g2586.t1